MPELHAFLLWLIFVVISAIAIGYFIKYYSLNSDSRNEGFIVYTCPVGSTKYITNNGETNCCNGDIVDSKCTGNNVCSLSPTNTLRLPTCHDYAKNEVDTAAAQYCFPVMPYYFASSDGLLRGCSASHATSDGTAPADQTMLQCRLYPTAALDKVRLDSCYNYKLNQDTLGKPTNCPAPIPTLPESFIPVRNTVLMNSFTITSDYELEFDITPTADPAPEWRNIIHFSSNDQDGGAFGSRSPAIWFVPGTHNLHVRVGDFENYNFGFDSEAGCSLNNQSHVILRCKGKNLTLYIDSNVYTLTQPTKRYNGNVKVYGSDPWWSPAGCKIDNLRIHTVTPTS